MPSVADAETVTIKFSFGGELATAKVASAVATATAWKRARILDPAPESILNGDPVISDDGQSVMVSVHRMIAWCTYKVKVIATTDENPARKLAESILLPCQNP